MKNAPTPWRAIGNDVWDADGNIVAQAVSKEVAILIAASPGLLRISEDLHERTVLNQAAPSGLLNVLESIIAKAKGLSL